MIMGQHHSTSHSKHSKDTKGKSSITRKEVDARTSLPPSYSSLSLSPQNLPIDIELVRRVARYLDPVSRLCLCYTCSSLFKGLQFQAEAELGKLPKGPPRLVSQTRDSGPHTDKGKKAPQYDLKREGRLQLLRLLHKDRRLFGKGTSVCGACLDAHRDTLFLASELKKPDAQRSCLGLTGKVWVCPHRSLTYEQVTSRDSPNTSWECFSCASIHVTTPSQSSSRVCIPIEYIEWPTVIYFPSNEMAVALASLGRAYLCPHVRLSDTLLTDCSVSHSRLDRKPLLCDKCDAAFHFESRPTERSLEHGLLQLVVERSFEWVKAVKVTDWNWVAQLEQRDVTVEESKAKSADDAKASSEPEQRLDAMKTAWTETLERCVRVMHVGDMKHDVPYVRECRGCLKKECLKAGWSVDT